MDTSVRLCRQVEAADVELGKNWDAAVQKQAQRYCTTLEAQKEGEELGWFIRRVCHLLNRFMPLIHTIQCNLTPSNNQIPSVRMCKDVLLTNCFLVPIDG